ncbi:MAG: DUF3972 domain-containing protein [Sulfurospirillaceae bacterium]|jgi:hypothetical protein|nr:DUF3972 domain-containing protein [Sulfurospirillaceae bacterium]MDD2827653.1 DUF3972 domain-containing protein [Sulfurospirillaceae bacterium]
MQTWLAIEEFSTLVDLDLSVIQSMIDEGKLTSKSEANQCYIEVNRNAYAIIPSSQGVVLKEEMGHGGVMIGSDFVEKTVGAILSLHEKVLDAKEETLDALKGENRFLKEALFSMQELYDEDRKTIETLTKQLALIQDELEFTKRKYKMMWNKAVEGYTPPPNK